MKSQRRLVGPQVSDSNINVANIISYWKLEDNALDEKDINNGVPTNLTYTNGTVGRSGVFSDSRILIPNDPILSFTDGQNDLPFSVSFIISFSSTGSKVIISKYNNTSSSINNEWYVWILNTNKLRFGMASGDSVSGYKRIGFITNVVLTVNTIYHVTCTYSGNKTSGGCKIYVDGINVAGSYDQSLPYNGQIAGDKDVSIGSQTDGLNKLSGELDEIILWNKELDDSDILELKELQMSGGSIT